MSIDLASARGLTTPHFLGVERSLTGRRWRPRLDAARENQALAITQTNDIDDLTARILAGRGVSSEQATAYLDPTLRDLMPDPSTLADMDAAVDRLLRAIEAGEQIALFGDYDVDGAASCALMVEYLEAAGTPTPLLHIPDRILEGYGPNSAAVQDLAARGATLLITLDCGTTSHTEFEEARRQGMDIIVLDHHQAPETLPSAIVVNPNREDDLSGQGRLCAAGVVFLTLAAVSRALRQRGFWTDARPPPNLLAMLDIVALATVADVASLTGLNRAFVAKGLAVMRRRERVGLAALMDAARMDGPPQVYHLGFVLGPRINAGGRIGDASLGVRLLTMRDRIDAARIASTLDRLNAERQSLERATLEVAEAEATLQLMRSNNPACLIVGGDDWHPGVVGLIASRLKEKFKLPSFAFAFAGEYGTGSARSMSGVDLGRAVRRAVEAGIAEKGGGHAMAAGATVARARLDEFRAFMNEALLDSVEAARSEDALVVDAALTARGATLETVRMIERAGPFGAGNPEPIVAFPTHTVVDASVVGSDHVRARLQAGDGARLDAIAFRAMGSGLGPALLGGRGRIFHVAARLGVNFFRGAERVETRIVDIADKQ